jgi:hypothetical protein
MSIRVRGGRIALDEDARTTTYLKLTVTLHTLGEAAAAEALVAEHLQWLLAADEDTLAADQRKVRAQFQQRPGTC